MPEPVIHMLTRTIVPDALCQDPEGDGTQERGSVTCSDCLSILERQGIARKVQIMRCDGGDQYCTNWAIDRYNQGDSEVLGVAITATTRARGWTSTKRGNYCAMHTSEAHLSVSEVETLTAPEAPSEAGKRLTTYAMLGANVCPYCSVSLESVCPAHRPAPSEVQR